MAACRAGPSEYQGLMNTLKRKMDDGNHDIKEHTQTGVNNIQKELKEHKQALNREMQALKQELQAQLAEVIQILRSKPSA